MMMGDGSGEKDLFSHHYNPDHHYFQQHRHIFLGGAQFWLWPHLVADLCYFMQMGIGCACGIGTGRGTVSGTDSGIGNGNGIAVIKAQSNRQSKYNKSN